MEGILCKMVISSEGTSIVKRGWIGNAVKSSHVGPYEGCVHITWDAKARARHRLDVDVDAGPSESRDSDISEARPVG